MSPALQRLLAEINQLSDEDRHALTQYLLSSCDCPDDEGEQEIRAAWETEIERRISECANDPGIPYEEVMAEMRRKYDSLLDSQ